MMSKQTYAVILVGGKGKRLRPLSTGSRPKAFLSVTKDRKTMFRKTVDRARRIFPSRNILVVANKAHANLVKNDFPDIDRGNLLLEPASRNTAPAIYFASLALKNRAQDAILAVLPTDQYVMDDGKYLHAIKEAIDFAKKNDNAFLVLGVKPKYSSTEFGYVKLKTQNSELRTKGVYKVEKFVEKPDLKTAKRFVKSGRYLWNTGSFIFSVSAILNAFKRFAPEIYNRLKDLNRIDRHYSSLPDISIDYAVMEKAKDIYCVEGAYEWQDMGNPKSLKEILQRELRDFVIRDGKVIKIL